MIEPQVLARCFKHTTTTYKFYWFLSILDELEERGTEEPAPTLSFDQLEARMLGHCWYPANAFRVDFGKQDRLASAARRLFQRADLKAGETARKLVESIERLRGADTSREDLLRYVPYAFLSPWFRDELSGIRQPQRHQLRVRELATAGWDDRKPPYRFLDEEDGIELHREWAAFLRRNLGMVRAFCLYELAEFLQRRNPGFPDLIKKLTPPASRQLGRARRIWGGFLASRGKLRCPYSGNPLPAEDWVLDHFVPWSLVAHDEIWNLVPTTRSVNSSKGDAIPLLHERSKRQRTRQFESFLETQHSLLRYLREHERSRPVAQHLKEFGELLDLPVREVVELPDSGFAELLGVRVERWEERGAATGFPTGWILKLS